LHEPAYGLKYHTGSRLEHVQLCGFPIQSGVKTGENGPMTEREGDTEIMMRLWELFIELRSVFSKKQTETYFSLEQDGDTNI
jgi:hypothetical protein